MDLCVRFFDRILQVSYAQLQETGPAVPDSSYQGPTLSPADEATALPSVARDEFDMVSPV